MKGNVQDLMVIPALLFGIAIAGPALWAASEDFMHQLGVNFDLLGFTTASQIADQTAALYVTWDQAFLVLAVGLGLATIISSYFVDSHPIFFFVSCLIFLIAMTIAPLLSNMYNDYIVGFSGFDALQKLPVTSFILQNYPLYLLGVFCATGIALYAKFVRGRE